MGLYQGSLWKMVTIVHASVKIAVGRIRRGLRVPLISDAIKTPEGSSRS